MNNALMKMMLGQLQARNPQMASQIQQAMSSGANPKQLMKQMISGVDNKQMQQVLTQAKSMGMPEDMLKQVQNIK